MIAELAPRRKKLRGFMRYFSLVTVSLLAACSFRAPRGIPVRVSGHVRAEVRADVRADVRVEARAKVDTVVVPLQGAPVTEFFGIPLADAREVLFVLDVSGSMAENAAGQLVAIPPPPPATEPSPPAATAPGEPAPPGTQPPRAPDPSQPPSDPSATVPPAVQPQQPGTRVPTKMEVAQAELIETLARLPAGTRLNILIFSNLVDAYAPDLVVVDEASRADLIGFVRDLRPLSATALQPAMRMAFLTNAPRIVLLSDGLGNIGGGSDDIMREVSEARRGGVRIDTIGIGPAQDAKLLTALAAETGGLYQRF
jgi:hypothetical protein